MKSARLALAFVFIACLTMSAHFVKVQRPRMMDFQAYETAAALVSHGESRHIYDGTDEERRQLRFAGTATAFAQQARELGIPRAYLYLYPPLLADFMIPFGSTDTETAKRVWFTLNILALIATAALFSIWLEPRKPLVIALVGILMMFAMTTIVSSLFVGQITLFLLLLWTAGIYSYHRDWKTASAAMFAVAGVIKLTPLIAVFPFLIWREWRWVLNWVLSITVLALSMLALNGPATLADYFQHVAPSIANGIPIIGNRSLLNAAEMLYVSMHGGDPLTPVTAPIPSAVILAGKALAALSLALTLWVIARMGRAAGLSDREMILALLALLSACIAPVSWDHAYTIAFLPLGLLWVAVLREQRRALNLLWLTLASIELGSLIFDSAAMKLLPGPLVGASACVAPLTGVALVITVLWQISHNPAGQQH